MTDLTKLIERVEAGDIPSKFDPVFERALYREGEDMVTRVYVASQAYNGSVDAALALKAELVPEWLVENISEFEGVWLVKLPYRYGGHLIEDPSLARALLLAILKAYKWEQEQ